MSGIQERIEAHEHQVDQFIEQNRPVLEDPELGPDAAHRLAVQTAEMIIPLANELTDILNDAAKAANLLADAIRDPHCSAGEINEREKEHRSLRVEAERLRMLQEQLLDFQHEVEERRARAAAEQIEIWVEMAKNRSD